MVTYYHNDALGSPIIATDQDGRVVWRKSYTPYGQPIGPAAPNEPGYTGKFEEPDLGIQYFGARWYDPRIGRFLGIDPAGFDPQNPQSFNRYAYANNNPYGFVDPDGRAPTVPYGPLFDPGMAGGSYGMGYGRTYRAQTPPRATVQGTAEAGRGNRGTEPSPEAAKGASEVTTKAPVVIGESMKDRVIPTAKEVAGHVYKPHGDWTAAKQERWAKDMKRQVERGERDLMDIGRDPERALPSEAYSIERRVFYGE